MQIRPAVRADVPAIVALPADDHLGHRRESIEHPLDDGLASYESLGFAVTHQGMEL